MNNIIKKRISMKQRITLLTACSLFILQFFAFGNIIAQPLLGSGVRSNLCGDYHCCQLLEYTVNNQIPAVPITDLFINCGTDDGTAPSCNCWNWACNTHWQVTQVPAPAITVTVLPGGGWHITFNPALTANNKFSIMLCPSNEDCAYHWYTFAWNSSNNGVPVANGNTPIGGCPSNTGELCPRCDRVDLSNPSLYCYERVCITRHWPVSTPGTGGTWIVTFNPPLGGCNNQSITGCDQYGQPPLTGPTLDQDEINAGWRITPGPGSSYTITGGPPLEGCASICFNIPKCNPPVGHTVSVFNPNDPSQCVESSASAAFKTGAIMEKEVGTVNYPNPLSAATQFKTTIPFTTANGGDAKISLFDETGRSVYTDIQNFDGSGKHFFYFTGEQLPAGKYFYTIQSPLGVTIVKKSLLIVK